LDKLVDIEGYKDKDKFDSNQFRSNGKEKRVSDLIKAKVALQLSGAEEG